MASYAALARAAGALAMGQLGWRPAEFWSATPMDLQLALEGRFGTAAPPLGGRELERLKERLGDG